MSNITYCLNIHSFIFILFFLLAFSSQVKQIRDDWKSIVGQEDRFKALKRLTTLELKKQQQEEKKAQEEKPNYLSQYLEEFKTLEEKEQDQLRQQEIAEKEAKRIEAENLQKVNFFFNIFFLFLNKITF